MDNPRMHVVRENRESSLRGFSLVEMLLAVFAWVGHPTSPSQAARAFQLGFNQLLPRIAVSYQPPQRWHQQLDSVLQRLDTLMPLAKAQLLDAIEQRPILMQRPIVRSAMGVRLCRPAERVLDILPPTQKPANT